MGPTVPQPAALTKAERAEIAAISKECARIVRHWESSPGMIGRDLFGKTAAYIPRLLAHIEALEERVKKADAWRELELGIKQDAILRLEECSRQHASATARIEALEAVAEAGREFLEASTNHVDRLILIQKGDAFGAALQRPKERQR